MIGRAMVVTAMSWAMMMTMMVKRTTLTHATTFNTNAAAASPSPSPSTHFLVVLLRTFFPPWNLLRQGNVSLGTWSGWKGQRQIEFKGGKTLGATQISGWAIPKRLQHPLRILESLGHNPRLYLHIAKIA